MITFSYIPKKEEYEKFGLEYKKLKNIKGIETVLCNDISENEYKRYPIVGGHLIYFPTWLEFWKNDKEKLLEDFINEENIIKYYGSLNKNILIENFKKQFLMGKKLNVKYMVFHVSHVRPKDIFNFSYEYSSFEVLKESVEIINEVFQGDGPLLLFENLPWPGLTLKNYHETKYFYENIEYKNKGFLLDLSHMICTEKNIKNYKDADTFILDKIENLKELASKIYGVHINGIEFSDYINRDFSDEICKWEKGDRLERFYIEMNHIKKIDSHKIYRGNLKKILEKIPEAKYLNFELEMKKIEEVSEKIKDQWEYFIK